MVRSADSAKIGCGNILLGASWEGHFKHPLLPAAVKPQDLITPPDSIPLTPLPVLSLRLEMGHNGQTQWSDSRLDKNGCDQQPSRLGNVTLH